MFQLKFSNPVFHDGLNTTVRLGTEWSYIFNVCTNKGANLLEVEIAHPDSTPTGQHAIIEATEVCTFYTIRQSVLQLEHDPSCQTMSGLYTGMKTPYGEEFNAGSIVTVVYFRLK